MNIDTCDIIFGVILLIVLCVLFRSCSDHTDGFDTLGGVEMRAVDVTTNTDYGFLNDTEKGPKGDILYMKFPNHNTAIKRMYNDVYTLPSLDYGEIDKDGNTDASDKVIKKANKQKETALIKETLSSSRAKQIPTVDRT